MAVVVTDEWVWRDNAKADCRERFPTKGRMQQSLQEVLARYDDLVALVLRMGDELAYRDVLAGPPPPVPRCGQRSAVPVPDLPGSATYYTDPCVLPRNHGAHHRDADDYTWTETTR